MLIIWLLCGYVATLERWTLSYFAKTIWVIWILILDCMHCPKIWLCWFIWMTKCLDYIMMPMYVIVDAPKTWEAPANSFRQTFITDYLDPKFNKPWRENSAQESIYYDMNLIA
jgi:hypothetical protein